MDKLKIAGLIVVFLLVFLLSITYINTNPQIDENAGIRVQVDKENITEVKNNGGNVLEYNGYIYYINVSESENGFSNKLCRRKINDAKEEVLYNANQSKIQDRLMIYKNNIFFCVVNQTYYVNLEDTKHVDKYNQGILYYIGNNNLIFQYENLLYRAEYYENTLAINRIKNIMKAKSIFINEDEENLYFYEKNNLIVSVNKESLKVNYLYKTVENSELEIINSVISEKYVYFINKNKDKYEIMKLSKKDNEITVTELENSVSNNIYTVKNDLYFYVANTLYKYNGNSDKIKESDIPKKAKEYYEVRMIGKNVELLKNNENFCTMLKGVDEQISDVLISEVGEHIYIKFKLNNLENQVKDLMLWQIRKDGTNLLRLNNTF